MRKTLFFLLALLGAMTTLGSEYEYMPLVREGVKWNYLFFEPNPINEQDFDFYYQYSLTFAGDTVINSKTYEKCFCLFEGDSYLVAFVREMDKAVYGIRCEFGNEKLMQDHHLDVAPLLVLDGEGSLWYNVCPFLPWETRHGEVAMYDFNLSEMMPSSSLIEVNGAARRVYDGWFIEGVGPFVGEGNILHPTDELTTNTDPHTVGLISVTLVNGSLEFAGSAYSFVHPHDPNRDGTVDIEDVSTVINCILHSDKSAFSCDVNGDGRVDIDDVNAVINALLAQ